VATDDKLSHPGANPHAERQSRMANSVDGDKTVKAKVFEVILHKLSSGKSPASVLEEQLNDFLTQRPDLRVMATHMNTIVSPAEPNAMPRSEESSVIIFCTVFYTE
jgi:hypothetical protein